MEPISNVLRPLLPASLLSGASTVASRLDRQDRKVVGEADAPETAASNLGLQSRIAGATASRR
jgi:hypothetical protein